MKNVFSFSVALIFSGFLAAQTLNSGLQLHYTFAANPSNAAQVLDVSGNGYNASLLGGAAVGSLGANSILALGAANGYADMGTNTGTLIASLNNFSIATCLYIDPATSITGAGNFVWTFSTSTACSQTSGKYVAYRVNAQRYAQSTGGWGSEAVSIQTGSAAAKGVWKHVAYVQEGSIGAIFIDGAMVASGTADYKPSNIGTPTLYNWIGRPPFSGDVYLKNASLADFRIYNRALSTSELTQLTATATTLNAALAQQTLLNAYNSLTLGNTESVRYNMELPQRDGQVAITWQSSNAAYLTATGVVTRPAEGTQPVTVQLTATLSLNGQTMQKVFNITILPAMNDTQSVEADKADLEIAQGCYWKEKIFLPQKGKENSNITWTSNNQQYISNQGNVIQLPAHGSGNLNVTLTALLTKGNVSQTKSFTVCINEDEGYSGYLFAYFTGNSVSQEQIRFAISRDGYTYKALNGGNPIISSDTIALMGGVRDPHILRGADGYYYMVVTDMKSSLGWSSNHGIVLLKSSDLTNWTHSTVDFRTKYPFAPFNACDRAWAPQTIYDAAAGKYMIYLSLRFGAGGADVIYRVYVNDTFTDLEGTPQVLFNHPQSKSCIDGDIIYENGQYNLFFKTEGDGNGIKKAISATLTGNYVLQDKYLQQTTEAVEGSCVFKLINQNKYILMYDVYNNGRYEFTESTDLENFSVCNDAVSMDFTPRHGTVIPITEAEATALMEKWGGSLALDILKPQNPAVRQAYWTKNTSSAEIFLPVRYGTDLTTFAPDFSVLPGLDISPATPQNFTAGIVNYTVSAGSRSKTFKVTAEVNSNPVLEGFFADPQVLYSHKTGKYYIYATSDGFSGWGGYDFHVFSSENLAEWTDEGVILDMHAGDVPWADGNAWAPAIIEKQVNGEWKYFYYFSGNPVAGGGKKIGVAVANDPTGVFIAQPEPMISTSPTGGGQQIDPCVFADPVSGKNYIYWGNGYLAVAELSEDMLSLKPNTTKVITPSGGSLSTYAYREGAYVFYRNGVYFFMWSVDDTGAANYHVAYGYSTSPTGPITVAASPIVLIQDAAKKIYGTGHHSVLQIPDRDEWYLVYHRINAAYLTNGGGYHREVCIDKMEFNGNTVIKNTRPTHTGVLMSTENGVSQIKSDKKKLKIFPNPVKDELIIDNAQLIMKNGNVDVQIIDFTGRIIINYQLSIVNSIDVSALSSGIYFLKIGNEVEKFVKE